jgi:hypothetical protein
MRCCVPFCRHTTKRVFAEWICGEHWRHVDPSVKRMKRTAERRFRGTATYDTVWERCKAQAIERAVGI